MWFAVFLLIIFSVSGQDYNGGAPQAFARSGNDYYGDNSQAFSSARSGSSNGAAASAGSSNDYYGDNSQPYSRARSGPSNGAVASAGSSYDYYEDNSQAFSRSRSGYDYYEDNSQAFSSARSGNDYYGDNSQAYSRARSGSSNGGVASARSSNDYYGDNSQAYSRARSGPSNGAVASARSRTRETSYRQQPAPVKGKPTRAPIISTTPDGAGTTVNDKNPVGGSTTNILNCALDNIKGMMGGTATGMMEVLDILMKNPPDKAVMMVLNNSLNNLSENDMKDLKAGLDNGMNDMYQMLAAGGAI